MDTKDFELCSQRRICFKFTVDASVSDTGKLGCTSDLVCYGGNKILIRSKLCYVSSVIGYNTLQVKYLIEA